MLKTIILIVVSFFAVIGILECMVNALESVSTSKFHQVKDVCLLVTLSGEIKDVDFLLNTLLLQAERINYWDNVTTVLIRDGGLDENTYIEISDFCLTNKNITMEN